ncbi:hypothetical protein KIW84_034532 [Lathyrus oleraceus]|uniref:Uncharacterized protein n=1 Tax=Pisum sativum TaxID=3888 RepID=A0A9D4Y0K8_PEA|nr:hypothetical protein KIW84_034532 [Pisum sativum]
MVNDKDVDKVYKYTNETKCVVHLYVDHSVRGVVGVTVEEDEHDDGGVNVEEEEQDDGGVNVEEEEQCDATNNVEEDAQYDCGANIEDENSDGSDDIDDSDYETSGITFDDSEEEMDLGLDDGFDMEDHTVAFEATQPQPNMNDVTYYSTHAAPPTHVPTVAYDYDISLSIHDYIAHVEHEVPQIVVFAVVGIPKVLRPIEFLQLSTHMCKSYCL